MSLLSDPLACRLLQALCFVWAGLVLGISFLEAPVKFGVPSVTRRIGLDVGRHVFAALNTVEIGAAVLGGGLLLMRAPGAVATWALGSVGGVLAVQSLWLLPVLRRQAATIIEGGSVPDANYVHVGYVCLEASKVGALLLAGWQMGL